MSRQSTDGTACALAVAPAQDIRAASATRALQDAAGQASNNALLVLLGAPLVARAAVCGNQVCEAGERAPASTSNLGERA